MSEKPEFQDCKFQPTVDPGQAPIPLKWLTHFPCDPTELAIEIAEIQRLHADYPALLRSNRVFLSRTTHPRSAQVKDLQGVLVACGFDVVNPHHYRRLAYSEREWDFLKDTLLRTDYFVTLVDSFGGGIREGDGNRVEKVYVDQYDFEAVPFPTETICQWEFVEAKKLWKKHGRPALMAFIPKEIEEGKIDVIRPLESDPSRDLQNEPLPVRGAGPTYRQDTEFLGEFKKARQTQSQFICALRKLDTTQRGEWDRDLLLSVLRSLRREMRRKVVDVHIHLSNEFRAEWNRVHTALATPSHKKRPLVFIGADSLEHVRSSLEIQRFLPSEHYSTLTLAIPTTVWELQIHDLRELRELGETLADFTNRKIEFEVLLRAVSRIGPAMCGEEPLNLFKVAAISEISEGIRDSIGLLGQAENALSEKVVLELSETCVGNLSGLQQIRSETPFALPNADGIFFEVVAQVEHHLLDGFLEEYPDLEGGLLTDILAAAEVDAATAVPPMEAAQFFADFRSQLREFASSPTLNQPLGANNLLPFIETLARAIRTQNDPDTRANCLPPTTELERWIVRCALLSSAGTPISAVVREVLGFLGVQSRLFLTAFVQHVIEEPNLPLATRNELTAVINEAIEAAARQVDDHRDTQAANIDCEILQVRKSLERLTESIRAFIPALGARLIREKARAADYHLWIVGSNAVPDLKALLGKSPAEQTQTEEALSERAFHHAEVFMQIVQAVGKRNTDTIGVFAAIDILLEFRVSDASPPADAQRWRTRALRTLAEIDEVRKTVDHHKGLCTTSAWSTLPDEVLRLFLVHRCRQCADDQSKRENERTNLLQDTLDRLSKDVPRTLESIAEVVCSELKTLRRQQDRFALFRGNWGTGAVLALAGALLVAGRQWEVVPWLGGVLGFLGLVLLLIAPFKHDQKN